MRNQIAVALLVGGLSFASVVQSALVTYTVEGQLDFSIGPADSYHLDGAIFTYKITVDTESIPFGGPITSTYAQAFYGVPLNATMQIINRPGGWEDIFSTVTPFYSDNKMSMTTNAYPGSCCSDSLTLWQVYVDDLPGLRAGRTNTGTITQEFFSGTGYASLPENWGEDEVSSIGGVWVGGSSYYYDSEITSFTFSEVPIPAAAWLFGSGLIGLVGLKRRQRS